MQHWVETPKGLRFTNIVPTYPKLENKIYRLLYDDLDNCYKLLLISDKFKFKHKIYGLETEFIHRVLHTFNNTYQNIGVLLNGIQGSGKTVSAKILCNSSNLPVILVEDCRHINYINDIQQDIVVFIDEFEKKFTEDWQEDLLEVMDGAATNSNRRLFLLTTNTRKINNNLIDRPKRIRYVKDFSQLNLMTINEVIDDCLLHKEYKEDLLVVLSKTKLVTIDVLLELIREINLFRKLASELTTDMNIFAIEEKYDLYINNELKVKNENLANITQFSYITDISQIVKKTLYYGKDYRIKSVIEEEPDVFIATCKEEDVLKFVRHKTNELFRQ